MLLCLPCLPRLDADVFTFVTNALALIRLRGAQATNVSGNLTHHLAINAIDNHLDTILHSKGDIFGRLDLYGVREAEIHHQACALHFGAIPYALDLQYLAIACA